jgi:hypothetical protein
VKICGDDLGPELQNSPSWHAWRSVALSGMCCGALMTSMLQHSIITAAIWCSADDDPIGSSSSDSYLQIDGLQCVSSRPRFGSSLIAKARGKRPFENYAATDAYGPYFWHVPCLVELPYRCRSYIRAPFSRHRLKSALEHHIKQVSPLPTAGTFKAQRLACEKSNLCIDSRLRGVTMYLSSKRWSAKGIASLGRQSTSRDWTSVCSLCYKLSNITKTMVKRGNLSVQPQTPRRSCG